MLRRTGFKPRKPSRHEPASTEREPKPLAKVTRWGTAGATSGVAVPKQERAAGGKAEQEHKAALVELGCMVCRRLFPFLAPGPVELHHLRGGGWGKGDWTTLVGLCVEHHRGDTGVHGLGTRGFVKHYGFTQADLLLDAMTLLKGKA
jgi:hypothetical protein